MIELSKKKNLELSKANLSVSVVCLFSFSLSLYLVCLLSIIE